MTRNAVGVPSHWSGPPLVETYERSDQHLHLAQKYFALDNPSRLLKKLPAGARRGVYLAYLYYIKLFYKIKRVEASRVMQERIRIPNGRKMGIMVNSLVRHSFNIL